MHRFFLPPGSLTPGAVVSLDPHAHQLHAVLRLSAGAALLLLDGSGLEYRAEIATLDARHATARVLDARACPTEPRLDLALYQCSLKGEKFEWVLQKGTELGVRRFVPVVSRRSVVRPVAALARKHARWQAVIREAAEQSQRGRLPELAPPLDFAAALLHAQGRRLLPWEGAAPDAPPPALDLTQPVSLLIGPEGGLDDDEVAAATAAGWQVVSLGPRILRAETAALAAVAALMARAGEMGGLGGR